MTNGCRKGAAILERLARWLGRYACFCPERRQQRLTQGNATPRLRLALRQPAVPLALVELPRKPSQSQVDIVVIVADPQEQIAPPATVEGSIENGSTRLYSFRIWAFWRYAAACRFGTQVGHGLHHIRWYTAVGKKRSGREGVSLAGSCGSRIQMGARHPQCFGTTT